jgi:hypothetical protein
MLWLKGHLRRRQLRDAFLRNAAREYAARHLDPVSHRRKDPSAGVGSVDLSQEYLAPEISECLVRERLRAHRKLVRRTNSDAGV